ncbi:MAG: iron ABC transporter permease [Candidatus Devosia euplotis]|nr:iron ABC transporter permease [Candidatus Devosia euplotis]
MIVGVSVGAVGIPLDTVWRVILSHLVPGGSAGEWSAGRDNIVWEVRLPRIALGAIVGASLALVGAAFQAVTRNQLTDPHLLGISSGAVLGAIVVLLHTGMFLGPATVPVFTFAGALATTALVVDFANFTGASNAGKLVLTGVAISFVMASLGGLGIFLGDPPRRPYCNLLDVGRTWPGPVGATPLPARGARRVRRLSSVQCRNLNAMTLGDESATSLGLPASRFRLVVLAICALLAGVAVAFSGIISFVGLMVPHLVRMVVGGDYRRVLPLSGLIGAIFLVLADMVARTIIPPQDVPLGVIAGVVGGIFFLALMKQKAVSNR